MQELRLHRTMSRTIPRGRNRAGGKPPETLTDCEAKIMGEVICVYRIMPESPESHGKVMKSLQGMEPNRLEEEPVAFGLKAIIFTKIIPDEPGSLERLENELNGIEGAGSVENIRTSRAI